MSELLDTSRGFTRPAADPRSLCAQQFRKKTRLPPHPTPPFARAAPSYPLGKGGLDLQMSPRPYDRDHRRAQRTHHRLPTLVQWRSTQILEAGEGARARAAADSPSGSSPDLTSSRPPLRPVTRETQDAWASPGCWKMKLKVAQSFPTLCNQARILRARILEWVAFPFSRGFSQPRDGTQLSRFAGGFFTS